MIYIQYLILCEAAFVYALLERLYSLYLMEKWMDEWRKSYDERMRARSENNLA